MFCNHYGKGQRYIPGEHLYAHFFSEGHEGLADLDVNILNPTNRETFWTFELDTFVPKGLNLRDLMKLYFTCFNIHNFSCL